MKIYALIYHKLALTQLWPKVVSWRFEKTTDVLVLVSMPVLQIRDRDWNSNLPKISELLS